MIEIGTTVKRTNLSRDEQTSGVILELQPMNKADVLWSNGTISQECLEYLIPVIEKQLSFEQPDKVMGIELARAEKLKKEIAVARAMYLPEKKMIEVMVKKGYDEDIVKMALYWKEKGRCYKPNTGELENGEYICPRCKAPMQHVRYRKQQPTWGCPKCFFIIKDRSILTPENMAKEYAKKKEAQIKEAKTKLMCISASGKPLSQHIANVINRRLRDHEKMIDLENVKYTKEEIIKNAKEQIASLFKAFSYPEKIHIYEK